MAYIGVSPSNGVRQKHTYTATASQTTFSGAGSEGVSLSYRDSNYVDVYVNGVKLGDADYTATSGTSIVLGVGAAVNDIIEIITYDVFSVADTVSKADGGTFDGNVAMAGTLNVTGDLTVDTSTLYVDSANNRVGVGTVSPDVPVEISVAGSSITNVLKLSTTSSGTVPALQFEGDASGTQHIIARVRAQQDDASNGGIVFETENSGSVAERARIDSSGNLLVGTTDAAVGVGNTNTGSSIGASGYQAISRTGTSGQATLFLNKNSNDGDIISFLKDGSAVGSIGVEGGDVTIGKAASGLQFRAVDPCIRPHNITTNSPSDATVDLGRANTRFKDFYLSGDITGANQLTSDDNTSSVAFAGGNNSNQGSNIVLYGPSYASLANVTRFRIGSTEKARIDASGNLLVGTTDIAPTSDGETGFVARAEGYILAGVNNQQVMLLNRSGTDGDILQFRKSGTAVGSIGVASSFLYIGKPAQSGIKFQTGNVVPTTGSINADATYDLGGSGTRFKDLYLSGGVYLGGTGSANKLDDYEEGTWTMTDQSGAGLSLTVYVSSYTKIGNQVFFEFGMVFPTTSDTNDVRLSLPFTSKLTADNTGGGGITVNSSGRTDTLVVIRNTATFGLQSVLNASATNANYSGKQLRVAGQYTV